MGINSTTQTIISATPKIIENHNTFTDFPKEKKFEGALEKNNISPPTGPEAKKTRKDLSDLQENSRKNLPQYVDDATKDFATKSLEDVQKQQLLKIIIEQQSKDAKDFAKRL